MIDRVGIGPAAPSAWDDPYADSKRRLQEMSPEDLAKLNDFSLTRLGMSETMRAVLDALTPDQLRYLAKLKEEDDKQR